jgi:hypothetical protein
MARKHFSWLVAPKGFISLIGAEYDLLSKAGFNVLAKFYTSSVIIVAILIISFLSIHYAIDLLFHMEIIELALSIFLSILFVFLYIFLLNTFTKKNTNAETNVFNLSNVIRIGFVAFIGYMISMPVNLYLFRNNLETEVAVHKQEVLSTHQQKIDALYAADLSRLIQRKSFFQNVSSNIPNNDLKWLNQNILELNEKKSRIMAVATNRVENSSFFIYRINLLSEVHKLSFLISIIIVGLFLLPGAIIYSISKNDEYYKLKSEYDSSIILNAYKAFTKEYSFIFLQKYNLRITVYSVYEDPPFNTKRKQDNMYQIESDFFKKYR